MATPAPGGQGASGEQSSQSLLIEGELVCQEPIPFASGGGGRNAKNTLLWIEVRTLNTCCSRVKKYDI